MREGITLLVTWFMGDIACDGVYGRNKIQVSLFTCAFLVPDLFSDADDCSGGPGDDLWLSTPL